MYTNKARHIVIESSVDAATLLCRNLHDTVQDCLPHGTIVSSTVLQPPCPDFKR